ncbi:XRCC4-like factor-domain-containing protein [Podospora appendiculata]|uniref:Non-homologous end-joining factor 1 n=1 Tax=Podospora appendiculata TaxID=314037 RepID=A0AAE0XI15_9PEZI|nr:XRCC4-like factor-domain-containing protein [Podospora appendiculata]
MPDHPSWRLLPVSTPGIPNLLVSAVFSAESYTVHLTDLANVWVESMDRKPIIKRGLVEDTSIDPSDGPDQIRKILELLRAAFDNNDPDHSITSLILAKGDSDDSLGVLVTCILPKPLRPFRWPMQLRKCPQSSLATELVLPLIQAHELRKREIEHLISALREKDGIITRLVDKLEATGTGLEHVFNSLSGKRKVTRAAAEGRIKGLAPFVEADIRNGPAEPQASAKSGPVDVPALLDSVFGDTGLKYKSDMDLEPSAVLNNWWAELGTGKHVVLVDRPRNNTADTPPPPLKKTDSKPDDDDDFQVQATPPGLRSARKRNTSSRLEAADDDETSDETAFEVLDKSPAPRKSTPSKPSGSRLGAIGRHSNKSPYSPAPAKASPKRTTADEAYTHDDSDTASDPDDDVADGHPPASPAKPAPRRGGLGRIGGKPREATPVVESARSPSLVPKNESSQPVMKHRLGVIGKKAPSAEPTAQADDNTDKRGRSKTPAAAPKQEQPRETSLERADRKRAELQRELERKAAAGPAKKKRKF